MSQTPLWIQVVLAIVSSGSIAAIVHLVRDQLRRRASRLYDVGYADISRIYEHIQDLLSDTTANRVLVLKSENGGGIPSPGCVVKSSVLYEVVDSPAKPISQSWQLVPLDQDYSSILAQVNSDGRAVVEREQLHHESLTHELLQAADATHCYVFRICATAHALLYLSVQYSCLDQQEVMSAEDHAAARGVLGKLGRIFQRHHQLVKRESQL